MRRRVDGGGVALRGLAIDDGDGLAAKAGKNKAKGKVQKATGKSS
jgi:hypothetical protein